MRTQTKAAIAVGAILVLLLGAFFVTSQTGDNDDPASEATDAATDPATDPATDSASPEGGAESGGDGESSTGQDSTLIREDSRIIGEEGSSDVTFVEFLDFECEACGAAYPIIEDLREQYAGEVTFVIRYFPLPSHFNSERAARAVESAARQGELEAMYGRMFETQREWGESQEPQDDLFRSYAEEIGLDMEQYDADYESAEVKERVAKDVADGTELGVSGTPTFYLDGELFQPQTIDDFSTAIDEALAQ